MIPSITPFFDADTFTYSYVVADPATGHCAIIDSVREYAPNSGSTSYHGADRIIAYVRAQGLKVEWILETHVHADHLTAAPYLKAALGGRTGIGARIDLVQQTFARIFNAEADFATDGSQFDALFAHGDALPLGAMTAAVLHTPGHTPACVTYLIGDAAFIGDTLFMPDYGTARCDFPGGDAKALYHSIRRLLDLDEKTRLFLCHDYLTPARTAYQCETQVSVQRATNIHIHEGVSEEAFVAMRTARDAGLDMPRLILPSVQVNMRAGALPPAEGNGTSYLKIPVDAL